MITIIALVMQVLMTLITPRNSDVLVIPPMPKHAPFTYDSMVRERVITTDNDDAYNDAYDDAWCEFTNLFNSYTYRVSKNGRSMINGKFVKMGV